MALLARPRTEAFHSANAAITTIAAKTAIAAEEVPDLLWASGGIHRHIQSCRCAGMRPGPITK